MLWVFFLMLLLLLLTWMDLLIKSRLFFLVFILPYILFIFKIYIHTHTHKYTLKYFIMLFIYIFLLLLFWSAIVKCIVSFGDSHNVARKRLSVCLFCIGTYFNIYVFPLYFVVCGSCCIYVGFQFIFKYICDESLFD